MSTSTRPRGLSIALAATLGLTGLAVFAAAESAAAAPHYANAPSIQIGYTDRATTHTAYDWTEGVDLPLGARTDTKGDRHKSRVYATFDLSQFAGKEVFGGTVRIRERSAADCTKRAIEIWRTNPVSETPTWGNAPEELTKLDEITTPEYCPTASITFDVSVAVQDAVAKGETRVTFALRVPEEHEGDVRYGRTLNWYNSVSLSVRYNSAPVLDEAQMYNGGRLCATAAPYPALSAFADQLQVSGSDPDLQQHATLGYEFALWPVDDPSHRTEISVPDGSAGMFGTGTVLAGVLVDGRSYSWQARVSDGLATSAWSKVCTFVVDKTFPSRPQISSANYPKADTGQWTPVGVPGEFTFSAGGDTDVIGFAYQWYNRSGGVQGCQVVAGGRFDCEDPATSDRVVKADVPGGTVTVPIIPPNPFTNTLYVQSVDRAGNTSAAVGYEMRVPSTEPTIKAIGTPEWGKPLTLKFTPVPGMPGVTKYEYRLNNGEPQFVTAGEDGTATISFITDSASGHSVSARSYSANGWISTEGNWSFAFDPGPGVTSDVYLSDGEPHGGVGVPGTFIFSPPVGWSEVGYYRYSFNGEDFFDVPAGPDGRASVTWTPETSGGVGLDVFVIRPDGTWGDYGNFYRFTVA
ncbi:hypothetical protein ONA70_10400 [Micromonospora yasonensis]|uniref:hypothetical protein n=1 Tax=Micromonospora yasonensis TaxID=1128667 RepID=UPI0022303EDF|nr:hypothetical protein [Micromonospora yasonensis]MCW3840505.1 hypothetical protein [Micromonospora yasonensis]